MENNSLSLPDTFINDVKVIVEDGRNTAYQSVNAAMVMTYWKIGKRIVQEEQNGNKRADYGANLINLLSDKLTELFGKGFSSRALRQFRQFYLTFSDIEKWNACVPFLTWTHFRSLMRVDNENARLWVFERIC